ncbi:MAG TPA: PilZ domain-containing protein [Verrucomicrobiae bacterium]|jgi:hypothetical protein|nr:PilZ domain-containing protein [Verrucomicrobiae bacterium]
MTTEHRRHPRFTVKVPVELHTIAREEVEGKTREQISDTPIRCNTSDLSLGGCYIESMYPFPVGTRLELKLQVPETLLILGRVVTSHPQFGNGIEFFKILPEDYDALSDYLDSVAKEQSPEASQ